jgi:nucleoside 2-deoxyribosyltransferase
LLARRLLSQALKKKKNQADRFVQKAEKYLGAHKVKVFVVMPVQGEQSGSQEEQRIYKEYDERFEVIEKIVVSCGGIAIRIDKEHALEDLVGRIKREIRDCGFQIADLTDERPSCYFEVGYAEALKRPVIYVSSRQSVTKPALIRRFTLIYI